MSNYHVIPNDGYDHINVANTCPCMPLVKGGVITHNPLRYREFTEEERAATQTRWLDGVYDRLESEKEDPLNLMLIRKLKLTDCN